jgi:hypothetical protein
MSTPTNLHRAKTTAKGDTRRRDCNLAELEEPKEGVLRRLLQEGEWRKNASSSLEETEVMQSFDPDPKPPPLELGIDLDQNTTSTPGIGINTPATAMARRRPSKAPQGAREGISYRSRTV